MKPERKSCGFKTIRIRVIRRASLVLVLFGFSFIDMFSMFSVFTCYKHFLVIKRLHPRKMCLIIIPLLKTFTLGFDCLCDFSISFDSRTYPLELKRNVVFLWALTIRPKIPWEFPEISMDKWYSLFPVSVEEDNCSLGIFQ